MSELTAEQILDAIDAGLEEAARWPQLLIALGFDNDTGRPSAVGINNALQNRGFRRVLDETDSIRPGIEPHYPDEWWYVIATEVARHRGATVGEVVAEIRKRAVQFA